MVRMLMHRRTPFPCTPQHLKLPLNLNAFTLLCLSSGTLEIRFHLVQRFSFSDLVEPRQAHIYSIRGRLQCALDIFWLARRRSCCTIARDVLTRPAAFSTRKRIAQASDQTGTGPSADLWAHTKNALVSSSK